MNGHGHPDGAEDDRDAAVWKSDPDVARWLAGAEDRERRRGAQRRLMADLLPFRDDEPFLFVDLGAGTGAAARAVLDRYPAATAILADFSPQMTAAGTSALDGYRGRFRYVDFDLAGGPWPAEIPGRIDAVVTSMCLHHLSDARKEQLVSEVFTRLAPGGWFLDFDLVAPADAVVEAAWRRADDRADPEAADQREHRSPEELHRDEHHRRLLSPLPAQLALFQAAGFEAIDIYWKRLEEVIIGGRRPLR